MYKRLIAVMLSCSLLGVSGLAHADDHRGHDRGRHEHRDKHHGKDRRDHDRGRHEWRGDRHDRRGPPPRVVVEKHYHQAPRHYAPPRHHHRWSRGEYVPAPYRGGQYVVVDYGARHLAPPPHGAHWINVGPDYFLIGMATGMVLQSVLSR
ncbi:RcnB family protein [Bordetella genomosp. 13]|uniref:RcnB family protein n=1 Tax=Bordetella genomosp. 13 TaxID=463040 RepID=UPI00119D90D8|nr:RcnB family protein [Bordetella genomosp. 13]